MLIRHPTANVLILRIRKDPKKIKTDHLFELSTLTGKFYHISQQGGVKFVATRG